MFIPIGTEEPSPRRRFPVVTVTIVALNVLVFLVEASVLFEGGEGALRRLINAWGTVPAAIAGGQRLYTLLTSMFLHGGLAHILFNMIYLLAFGDNVEDRLGRVRYVAFYLLAGFMASLAQITSSPASSVPSVGASGAIAGVLGGYLLLFPRGIVRMFLLLGPFIRITRVPALLFILFWFLTQFLNGVASLGVVTAETGGVAYWAHVGGFAGGLVVMWLYKQLADRR